MFKWISQSWFSCRKYMERLSFSFERELSVSDRIGFFVHHYCCRRCRVARTHFIHLNGSIDELAKKMRTNGELTELQELSVSPEYLEELKKKIREKKG